MQPHQDGGVRHEPRKEVDAHGRLIEVRVWDRVGVTAGHELADHGLPAVRHRFGQRGDGREPDLPN